MDPFQQVLLPDQIGDLADASPFLRTSWDQVRASHQRAYHYYTGEVFNRKVETQTGEDGAPLLYPVGINLVKMITLAMTDATYGEWDDPRNFILFKSSSESEPTTVEKAAVRYATTLLEDSDAASMLWELEFDRNLCGAGVLRIIPDLPRRAHVRWSKIPLDGFYPIFDPSDPNVIIECWQVTQILPEQAKELYGISDVGTSPLIKFEHWTRSKYKTKIDGKRVDLYSGVNPWGVVPYVYIPRMRTTDWWGESLVQDVFAPQDEINMRIADAGEALNYHSHPVFWGRNLPSTFSAKNYPLDPGAMWDLGRNRAGSHDIPEVGLLQATVPVSDALFKYVQFLYDFTRTDASVPPIAFGEEAGASQGSGVTLEIRLWPLLKSVRRSRAYLSTGFARALQITGEILKQKNFSDVEPGVADQLRNRRILPMFNNILPRDQTAIVDEVVKLLSTNPPAISLESAQMALGRGQAEVEKISKMLTMIEDWAPVEKALAAIRAANVKKPAGVDGATGGTDTTTKSKPDNMPHDMSKGTPAEAHGS